MEPGWWAKLKEKRKREREREREAVSSVFYFGKSLLRYAVFQFALSSCLPQPNQKALLLQVHVTAPLFGSLMVRWMCRKGQKLSYEQMQRAAMTLNFLAILNRVDVPRSLISTNFVVRTFIGAFTCAPCTLVTMNLVSLPFTVAVELNRLDSDVHAVDYVLLIANETMAVLIMSVIVLHLGALLQKQEMATQKLREEVCIKEKIVKETDAWVLLDRFCAKSLGFALALQGSFVALKPFRCAGSVEPNSNNTRKAFWKQLEDCFL